MEIWPHIRTNVPPGSYRCFSTAILFLNAVVGIQLLVVLFLAPSHLASEQLNGGMQYITPVITTKCLQGLDGIYYNLGNSIWDFKFRACQGII